MIEVIAFAVAVVAIILVIIALVWIYLKPSGRGPTGPQGSTGPPGPPGLAYTYITIDISTTNTVAVMDGSFIIVTSSSVVTNPQLTITASPTSNTPNITVVINNTLVNDLTLLSSSTFDFSVSSSSQSFRSICWYVAQRLNPGSYAVGTAGCLNTII